MKQLKKIKWKRWEEGLLVTMVGIKHAPSWGYPKLEDKKGMYLHGTISSLKYILGKIISNLKNIFISKQN